MTVRMPTVLRSYAEGRSTVTVEGSTVRQVLEALERACPGIEERLFEAPGKLRRFINVFVDDQDIRFAQGLDTPVPDGATVSLLPAVAGGCGQPTRPRRGGPRVAFRNRQ
ncbi:MAG TPA: ubiquitin-like small modifier protein 1 [Actinomycetota bacterium]|nr:ubiquitin-like small modifier protein 1 [Actinomycetota bacterium]